ncbi:MAG TPA: flagellar biosynthesis anti-sigma factor FlgM [Aquifex aeolicus]|uniref:Flagellar biosynthesis anti-sigma factor FlgM n=1 Tax=Aquifex aeolicus TaxID=63363 RepID=A0A9D0YQ84_AQUAO|nr:flagellar biosynthesis anti-sigma factor FlgM [Aquificales bacterium]HIP98563.1 flagellar biosynthesis anti-sigma factor FlgM [Aquifex aeolicus]HIQ26702.1 flagellar biosynthesis anti-sigma factor FlgM [Aquifex aeolicus]
MINPIGGGGINFQRSYERATKSGTKGGKETITDDGVFIDLPNGENPLRETAEDRVERLKKLISEGNYPLDRSKLAEKILDFLTDGR